MCALVVPCIACEKARVNYSFIHSFVLFAIHVYAIFTAVLYDLTEKVKLNGKET